MRNEIRTYFRLLSVSYGTNIKGVKCNFKLLISRGEGEGDYYIINYFNVQICTILRFHLGN